MWTWVIFKDLRYLQWFYDVFEKLKSIISISLSDNNSSDFSASSSKQNI